MLFSKRTIAALLCTLILSGCAATTHKSASDLASQEDILLKSKNYEGLINLYRSLLKEKEDPNTRLKLSRYYYQAGDYKSSLYYLQPLLAKADLNVYTQQAKSLIAAGDYPQAIRVADTMLAKSPKSGEAYNLRGIALASSGKLSEGNQSIQKARDLFIADDVAINNLAMVAMLDQRYQDAVSLLLPQYQRGSKQSKTLHNLVLALVKVGDIRYARNIIESENLSDNPNELIDALSLVGPLKKGVA